MYSHRSERSLSRRQNGDRSSRDWDDSKDRWEERRETHRDAPQDSYYHEKSSNHTYGRDGHSSTERTNKYSTSPQRRHSKDAVNRDWRRKSPMRRRISSPDWGAADMKKEKFADDKDGYRYKFETGDKVYRHSPDSFSQQHRPKDFERSFQQEEDFKNRKTSQDSRYRHQHQYKEFTSRQKHDDYRLSSRYDKNRDHRERSWDHSEERTRSQERSSSSCGKSRERDDNALTLRENRHQSRTTFPVNEPCGQSFGYDLTSPPVTEQKLTKGFQRFLDVLNQGVNITTLTQIVTQTSTEVSEQPHSSATVANAADHLWSPGSDEQQGSHQNSHHWSKSNRSERPSHHRSSSPKRRSLSNEKSLQRGDGEQGFHGWNNTSMSPTVAVKTTLTPEDEHKHKQMQDVLQAIGMDLGSEELGQMSHRIQERLYGKDSDRVRLRGRQKEGEKRQAVSPRPRSRSSSSSSSSSTRSSFSPLTRDTYVKEVSYSAQKERTEERQQPVHQAVEYGQNGRSYSFGDHEKCETQNSQEDASTIQTYSQNTTHSLLEQPLNPAKPTYSTVDYPPLPYPVMPPNLPYVGPMPFLPPYLPYPPYPNLNILPAVISPTSHLLPQHTSSPQSTFFNQANIIPYQPLNTTQKSKTQTRPRCLQVIETKQPG